MTYFYEITGWKNGSPKIEAEDQMTMKRALHCAERIMGGHYGEGIDRVEIREFALDLGLHSKTIFTFHEGKWEEEHEYSGEDEGEKTMYQVCLNSDITMNTPEEFETLEEAKEAYERKIKNLDLSKTDLNRLRKAHARIELAKVGENIETIESYKI